MFLTARMRNKVVGFVFLLAKSIFYLAIPNTVGVLSGGKNGYHRGKLSGDLVCAHLAMADS